MSNQTIEESSIPKSFTASVDRPFDPVGIRDLTTQLYDRNNQHLTDEQIQQVINNPQPAPDPNARVKQMSKDENARAMAEFEQEKVYNLSLKQLANRTTTTIHDILDDLVNFNVKDGIRGFIQIFIQSDRMVYLGFIIVAFTMLVMLFKSGDT